MNNIKINDYILQQDNAVSKEWCDEVIDYFNGVQSISRAKSAGVSPLKQDNKIYFLNKKLFENRSVVSYEMVSALDLVNVKLPKRIVTRKDFPGVGGFV